MSAVKTFESIKSRAEHFQSDAEQTFPEAASPGDYFRQGDLYIHRLEELPLGSSPIDVMKQLAPGTSKGSRHILSHTDIEMFQRENMDALTGPVFRNKVAVTITHPEHGDVVCPPGTYAVTYQRQFAEELRRVMD